MKNLKLSTVLAAVLSIVTILLQTGCSKDEGFYNYSNEGEVYPFSTYEYLKSKPGVYDSLLLVIERMGLAPMLMDSSVTLFAVSNQSFETAIINLNNFRRKNEEAPIYLSDLDYVQLDTMVSQYIIRGLVPGDSLYLREGKQLRSMRINYPMHAKLLKTDAAGLVNGGPEIIQLANTRKSPFTRDWAYANTESINIRSENGIIHLVSKDHVFGFGEFVKRITFDPPPLSVFQTVGGEFTTNRESPYASSGEGFSSAYDGHIETEYDIPGYPDNKVWFMFEAHEPVIVGSYTISTNADTDAQGGRTRDPRAWILSASHDGENWEVLDLRIDQEFEYPRQTKVWYFENEVAYKFYRVDWERTNGSGNLVMADWSLNEPKK